MSSASDWWTNSVIYHIYINSFKDGNGDGIGDFKGLASKLDYFSYLGANTLLLSPVNPSPMKDNGYDITDFMGINPMYGTMEDFENFMKEVKKRGLHVLIDLVVNHTSNEHEWFLKSIEGEEPYKDYYVWADPIIDEDEILPPNNWLSVFGGSAWEFNDTRQQFYLHQFLSEQPDLDWRNPDVREEVKKILRFWVEKEVDGFRVDAICHFLEDERMLDEPIAPRAKCKPDEYEYLDHIYTKALKQNHQLVREWRELLDECGEKDGKYKIILTEAYEPVQDLLCYYGDSETPISDVPFNVELMTVTSSSSARDFHKAITSWLDDMPEGKSANWILGNHDQPRYATRVGAGLVNGIHMVVTLLPGILFCYYGDEIGMDDCVINEEDMKDSFALRTKPENSRDPQRTPMQWNNEKYAGFCENVKPWLPINENVKTINVKNQQGDPLSVLEIYRKLLTLRKEPAIVSGIVEYPFIDGNIFSMIRTKRSKRSFLVVLNMGKCLSIVDFTHTSPYLPEFAYLEVTNNPVYGDRMAHVINQIYPKKNISSSYVKAFQLCSTAERKVKIYLNNVILLPKEAMVLSFDPLSVVVEDSE